MTPLTTRARELAARERKLYDQRTIPAVLEELADEADKLRAEAANSAAQRDEALNQLDSARHSIDVLEGRLSALNAQKHYWSAEVDTVLAQRDDEYERAERAEAELARIRAADRTSITVRTTEAAKMRKGQAI